jgi:hypothetical protein
LTSPYLKTKSSINVTDRILMRAATVVIITASSGFKRTASPLKARFSILINTATSGSFSTAIVTVTDRWWLHR